MLLVNASESKAKPEGILVKQVLNFSLMKKVFPILLIFLACLLNGCLSTLYPIFKEEDIIFNKNLLGYWKSVNENNYVEFKRIPAGRRPEMPQGIHKLSDSGYLVSKIDSTGRITDENFVFLARIGKYYYLDYYGAETASEKAMSRIFKDQFVKLHSSYRCDIKDNGRFEIRRFDKDFLDKLILNNKINIRHETVEGKNIITAPTEELQKFIIQYSDNPAAFTEVINYVRVIDY